MTPIPYRISSIGLLTVVGLGFADDAVGQRQTIPELVKEHGGDLEGLIHSSGPVVGLETLTEESTMIARVLITGVESHLAADETSIQTDYTVQVLELLHNRQTEAVGTLQPQRMLVTRPGGVGRGEGRRDAR